MARVRERRLRSMRDVKEALRDLEQDAGIRIAGRIGGFRGGGYIFVCRDDNGYLVNVCERIYERRLGGYTAGGKEEWLRFDSLEGVLSYISRRAKRPVEAWLY